MNFISKISSLIGIVIIVFTAYSCGSGKITDIVKDQENIIEKQFSAEGEKLSFSFNAGPAHNHPTFAIWLETSDGDLIQTLFVTKSIASGYFTFGDAGDGKWLKVPGEAKRPAALPYWLNRREIFQHEQPLLPTKNQPVPDAYTGATPSGDFIVKAITLKQLPKVFRVLVEVNQPWDWNKFWTNEKFSGDSDYKTSAQPSLVYAVQVNLNDLMEEYHLNPIGHGHPSGKNGQLYTDISGFTTALQIFQSISFIVNR
jgi:hypothetical protein